jgi:hypothetical protein
MCARKTRINTIQKRAADVWMAPARCMIRSGRQTDRPNRFSYRQTAHDLVGRIRVRMLNSFANECHKPRFGTWPPKIGNRYRVNQRKKKNHWTPFGSDTRYMIRSVGQMERPPVKIRQDFSQTTRLHTTWSNYPVDPAKSWTGVLINYYYDERYFSKRFLVRFRSVWQRSRTHIHTHESMSVMTQY